LSGTQFLSDLILLVCFLCDFILYHTFIPSLLASILWSLPLSLVLDCHSIVTCYLHQAYLYNINFFHTSIHLGLLNPEGKGIMNLHPLTALHPRQLASS